MDPMDGDPTIAALHPALALLRHDWVRTFFFATSSEHTLQQLDYALNGPVTMTGKLDILSNDPMPPTEPPENSHVSFLFAPSFTTGSLTVGFDLIDRLQNNPLHESGKGFSRAVRDDNAGLFLAVTEQPNGVTELAFCNKMTPGCRSMSHVVIKTSGFRYIVDNQFDEAVLKDNLLHTLYSLDIRKCPTCASDTLLTCRCALPSVTKKHPADYDSEILSITSYLGAFNGFASIRAYEGGLPVSITNGRSTMHTYVTKDLEWKRTLGEWAMRHSTDSCTTNLTKLIMPNVDQADSGEKRKLNALETFSAEECTGFGFHMPFADLGFNSDDEIMSLLASPYEPSDEKILGSNSSGFVPLMHGAREFEQRGSCARFEKSVAENGETTENRSFSGVEWDTERVMLKTSEKREKDCLSEDPASSIECGRECTAVSSGPSVNFQPREAGVERAYVIEHITPKKFPFIVPRTDVCPARTSKFTQELELKAEKRRERNRASALRSNEKKRQYLRQLKQDVMNNREKETVLRKKEGLLREENLKLRIMTDPKG